MFERMTNKMGKAAVVASTAVVLAACSQSESPLQTSVAAPTPQTVQQPLATGAPEAKRINSRRGTGIAVLVNKQAITSNQIKRRMAFVKLRRMKGNSRTIATNELIDESIKMQEARRIRAVVSEAEVSKAYARFAKNNKMPVKVLTQILNKRGVTQRGFKDFIKASMSWQRAVGARVRADAQGTSSGDRKPLSPSWLPPAGKNATKEQEYTIQQIVFIVPAAKRASLMSRRRAEAKSFRSRVRGCENARELAASLRDVTVLDRGRLLESQLPPRWIKQIKATSAGKVTRTQDDAKGVEMIAVCKKREVIGKSNGNNELFADGKFKQVASSTDKSYFAELKKRAVIVRR